MNANDTNARSVLRNQPYEVSSVRKALDLLTAFSPTTPEWSLSALARRLCLPKSTAHNLLRTLQMFDLVHQDPSRRVYRLGPRALELGLAFSLNSEVLAQARPVLRKLSSAVQETVKLGVLSSDEVLIVAAVESTHQLHTRGDMGTRWPLHSTSLGKAILSVLPIEEARNLVQRRGTRQFTERTHRSWKELRNELEMIRSAGYARDLEENERGVRCIAAPIVDGLRGYVAAVSISGPRVRLEDDRFDELAREVKAAAKCIAAYSGLEVA